VRRSHRPPLESGSSLPLKSPKRQVTFTPRIRRRNCSGRATAASYVKTELAEVGQTSAANQSLQLAEVSTTCASNDRIDDL